MVAQQTDIRSGARRSNAAHHRRLHHDAQLQHLARLVARGRSYRASLVRRLGENTDFGKLADRLAHHRAADIERFGQLCLGDALAGRQALFEDRQNELPGHLDLRVAVQPFHRVRVSAATGPVRRHAIFSHRILPGLRPSFL